MSQPASFRLRFSIHGLGVEVGCSVPTMLDPIGQALNEFSVNSFAGASAPIGGVIRPFDQQEVVRHLSPTAARISRDNDLVELYEEGERYWLIDDHCGLCEINILRGQWRSWVLGAPSADPMRVAERMMLWPVSQLLRPRGLCMIPCAAVVRDGWGALILSSGNIEPELSVLVRAGFRIVGQNWTALRDEDGRIVMLRMPGSVERTTAGTSNGPMSHRVDLTSEFCGSAIDRAGCDAVMILSPGRRPLPDLRPITAANAIGALRQAWPIAELHPHRRQGQLAARMAQRCRLFDVQLSRNPKDILSLMEAARAHRTVVAPPKVSVMIAKPQQRVVA